MISATVAYETAIASASWNYSQYMKYDTKWAEAENTRDCITAHELADRYWNRLEGQVDLIALLFSKKPSDVMEAVEEATAK